MKRKPSVRRVLSLALSILMVLQVLVGAVSVSAASSVQASTQNLVKYGDFESEQSVREWYYEIDKKQLDYWWSYHEADPAPVRVEGNAHTGQYAAKLSAENNSLQQDIDGLIVGAEYTVSVWAKTTKPETVCWFGVQHYGDTDKKVQINSTEYQKYTIDFTYTGVNNGRYFRIFNWIETYNGGEVYVDDISLTMKSAIDTVSIENGKMAVTFKDRLPEQVSAENFRATYSSSITPDEVNVLALTKSTSNGNALELTFVPIAAQPVKQIATVDLCYVPENLTLRLDFEVAASGAPIVTAELSEISAKNGSLVATLDKEPTIAPQADDFSAVCSVNNGDEKSLTLSDFVYNRAMKQVSFSFSRILPTAEEQQVKVKLTYNGTTKEDSFTVVLGEGKTYYVSSSDGDDSNEGLSSDKAFKTIEKLNTLYFVPGDQILFKKGDVFVGAFKPQGSGCEGKPIIVSSYGDGAKPVLQPGSENWQAYITHPDTYGETVWVNNVITFHNQQYWEVRDLELCDPASTGSPAKDDVYRRGIDITAEDAGELSHFYFDNLTIHGFHGPSSNIGKISGGIMMEIYATPRTPASEHIPTWFSDVKITNCELYDLGRSGINSFTVWARRTEDSDTKWGPYPSSHGVPWTGYTRNALKNITVSNNYIHHIDGDGYIVDTSDNVMCSNNLVYSCANANVFSVGLFNWNSDNVYFQENEVYGTKEAGDAQGIEIDALNDTTYVQYNYIHDNWGGSVMWCNTPGLLGFDGVFRYNIFQNDNQAHGLLDFRPGSHNGQVYNNTFYMNKNATHTTFIQDGAGNYSDAKFYNNIFYYPGDTKYTANTFAEDRIDWEANLFYNFANTPSNDTRLVTEDPQFKDPGKGAVGTAPGSRPDLSGYELSEGSPAINAGIPIAENGGRDYFGHPVQGIPDIGAYESGTSSMKLMSGVYTVNQDERKVVILDSEDMNVQVVYANLVSENGVSIAIKRGDHVVTDSVVDGDTIVLSKDQDSAVYTIEIAHDPDLLKLTSVEYPVDQETRVINIPDHVLVTAEKLLNGLTSGAGVEVKVQRDGSVVTDDTVLKAGDNVLASKGEYKETYTIALYYDASYAGRDIAVEDCSASAGSEERNDSDTSVEGPASLALDGKRNTIWCSKWDGDERENLYFTITFVEDKTFMVDGLRYLPRIGGGTNGIITKYKVQYSPDGVNFIDIPDAAGNWEQSGWQGVRFAAVEARAIRLYAVASLTMVSGSNYATAAEIRLTGGTKETEHIHTPELKNEKAATCTESGYTGDKVCSACKEVVEAGRELPALGHNYEVVTVPPTATEHGYDRHTCTRCGDSYRDNFVIPLSKPVIPGHVVNTKTESSTVCFTDVATDSWYSKAVKYVTEQGLMNGISESTFSPMLSMSRAMLVTVLYRMENEPNAGTCSFTDVAADTWYTKAVSWAAANGIVTGISETAFAPDTQITRESLVVILYRYAMMKKLELNRNGDLTAFKDSNSVSDWAVDAMAWAVGAGILSGKAGNVLDPRGTATRAEVATILMRFCTEIR